MSELKQRMSSREFSMWKAYLRIEPSLETQLRYVGAQIVSSLYNINRGKNQPVSVEDVLLKFESPIAPIDTAAGWKTMKAQLISQFSKVIKKEG